MDYIGTVWGKSYPLPKTFNSQFKKPIFDEDQLFDAIKDPRKAMFKIDC